MSIQAGLLGKERGQAVPVDHVEGAPLSHVDAADAIEGHTVQVALEADGYFVGLVLGAAREIESQPRSHSMRAPVMARKRLPPSCWRMIWALFVVMVLAPGWLRWSYYR